MSNRIIIKGKHIYTVIPQDDWDIKNKCWKRYDIYRNGRKTVFTFKTAEECIDFVEKNHDIIANWYEEVAS